MIFENLIFWGFLGKLRSLGHIWPSQLIPDIPMYVNQIPCPSIQLYGHFIIFFSILSLKKSWFFWFSKKTFWPREIIVTWTGEQFCIFKKITSKFFEFSHPWFFWILDFFILYAKRLFPVRGVRVKNCQKWLKNDNLKETIVIHE